jgi:hypothetical protein
MRELQGVLQKMRHGCIPIVLALRRLKQEAHELEISPT